MPETHTIKQMKGEFKMSKDKTNQKGITLIALVITIIVMLILVGVSVTVALNGGLFTTAKQAKEDTATERDNELQLSEGKVEINGEEYNSIDEYVNGGSSNNPTEPVKVAITPKKETYTIGEAVKIGEEDFYVIADDADKVTLLAKDNIDTTTLVQSASAGEVAFSSTNYWSAETEYPLDLNNYPIPEGETSVITTAKEYGSKLGGTGRLMTYEEATALETANSDILYGTNGKSSIEFLRSWLSIAENDYGLRMTAMDIGPYLRYCEQVPGISAGVRPVVEISKSNIS